LQQQVSQLAIDARILDVGAGRGDFAAIFQDRTCLALDVYPYPEVDLVCDLTRSMPLRVESFDAIALMNVLEHVYDTHALLEALAALLKPGGVLIMAIPFMVKIHQAPVDFVRYTHFALQRLGEEHGLVVESLEGYYDPISFLGEGIGNLKWAVLPTIRGSKHYLARGLLAGIQGLNAGLNALLGQGQTRAPAGMRSMAPTGYHILYRKN
jgi:SAM-dependent methyltransferase